MQQRLVHGPHTGSLLGASVLKLNAAEFQNLRSHYVSPPESQVDTSLGQQGLLETSETRDSLLPGFSGRSKPEILLLSVKVGGIVH